MKRAVIAIAAVALIAGGAWWLHRACMASMLAFESGYAAAAGDGGAR